MLGQLERYEGALALFERSIELDPDDSIASIIFYIKMSVVKKVNLKEKALLRYAFLPLSENRYYRADN